MSVETHPETDADLDSQVHDIDLVDDELLDEHSVSLFEGDEGGLEYAQRRALVTLLKQRFISARTHPRDWRVLVEHERLLRSRLNDLFLDLQVDRAREVAWKRQATSETGSRFPTMLYDAAWSREETLVLVHLRDRLRAGVASGDARVFVDREDVVRYVSSFRPSHATDVAGDEKRARNAITGIVKAGLLIGTGSEERFEISEAVEPLIPLELLQELLAALVAANDTEDPSGPDDTADLFDDEADAVHHGHRRPRRGAVSMSIDEIEQTPVDGLFERSDVATPADDTMQWRAALLQMVNWGGFDGLTVVPLRGDATMISGASGVGKSTILDAYTALMMPSDTKFNGASNDAVAGRARGAGQRNLLSYLRGAVDVVDDPRTGRPVEKLLRGKGADTWGAIAMTFVNDQGGRFTVLRTYYVPRRATRSADVQMQLATQDGALPLDTLEVAVPERFHATTLKKLYPGIRVHRTYAELAAVLHARLGIGANGDGAKALRLLARIQAGNQVRSVDELYKDMVLERPSTFAAADRAIEHFDDLDTAHSAMRTEEQKLELLAPITDLHDRKVAATRRLAELDSYGVTLDGDTPLRMWLLRTHLRLIESAVVDNRADRAAASDELGTTTSAERTYLADLEAAKESHRAAGGSTLQSLALSLEQEQVVREDRLGRREVLQGRLLPLIDATDAQAPDVEAALLSSESFAVLQMHAQQWLAGFQREQERIRRERDAVLRDQFPLSQRQAELRRERTSLESRAGRVPARMDELRAEVAQASGIGRRRAALRGGAGRRRA